MTYPLLYVHSTLSTHIEWNIWKQLLFWVKSHNKLLISFEISSNSFSTRLGEFSFLYLWFHYLWEKITKPCHFYIMEEFSSFLKNWKRNERFIKYKLIYITTKNNSCFQKFSSMLVLTLHTIWEEKCWTKRPLNRDPRVELVRPYIQECFLLRQSLRLYYVRITDFKQ